MNDLTLFCQIFASILIWDFHIPFVSLICVDKLQCQSHAVVFSHQVYQSSGPRYWLPKRLGDLHPKCKVQRHLHFPLYKKFTPSFKAGRESLQVFDKSIVQVKCLMEFPILSKSKNLGFADGTVFVCWISYFERRLEQPLQPPFPLVLFYLYPNYVDQWAPIWGTYI